MPRQSLQQDREASVRRVTRLMLLFMTGVTALACVLAALGRLTSLHDHLPVLAQFARIRLVSNAVAAVGFYAMAVLYRRGSNWPLAIVVLAMSGLLVPGMRHDLFIAGIPQMIWIPPLAALVLTSLRWLLLSIAMTGLLAVICHGHTPGMHNAPALFASAIIAALLVLARVLHDHTLRTERSQAHQIEELALFDPLTELPNRRLLEDRLDEGIKRSQRSQLALAVLFVDLDHFKDVNDTYGHKTGDQLLVEAAKRISACVRASDTIARFGGDEFVLVLPELSDRIVLARIATQITESLAAPFQLGDKQVFVTGSVGVALYPDDGKDHATLLRFADQALYHSKDSGRARYTFYTPALQEAVNTRQQLTDALRAALQSGPLPDTAQQDDGQQDDGQQDHDQHAPAGQLDLFYQPIVALASGRVSKAEALLRWTHPDLGAVSPATVIPLAESTGLIHPLGDWVLARAATQIRRWRTEIAEDFQVAINWSPVQFHKQSDPGNAWADRLARLGIDGSSLAIEITEGVLVDNAPQTVAQFESLRRAGVSVSIDDFGTGYSGLAYLQRFTVDCVKIDKSFVGSLTDDERAQALCRAIIVLAHELNMRVVAEGVETAAQHGLLQAAGADFAQGYYYARPMSAADFSAWIRHHHAAAAWA